MSEKFGEKLRKIRVRQNVTLEMLANAVGSSKSYIWQLENKKNAEPTASLLLRIANYLGESPDYFIDDSVDERTNDHLEDAFFRRFQKLSKEDKQYIEKLITRLDHESNN